MTILRLILGDQLNPQHSWLSTPGSSVVYVLMEVRQETDYVLHHAQKILAIFAAMRDFAGQLKAAGHRVHYLAIDDPVNCQALPANLDALIAPTGPIAWMIDWVNGDQISGPDTTSVAAVAGYPHITVPLGYVCDLPVGLSFIGTAWQEPRLIRLAYAFEQASRIRIPPIFPATVTPAAFR